MHRRKRTDRRWQAGVSARREKRRGEHTRAQTSAKCRPGGTEAGEGTKSGCLAPAPDGGLDTPAETEGARGEEVTQHGEPPADDRTCRDHREEETEPAASAGSSDA